MKYIPILGTRKNSSEHKNIDSHLQKNKISLLPFLPKIQTFGIYVPGKEITTDWSLFIFLSFLAFSLIYPVLFSSIPFSCIPFHSTLFYSILFHSFPLNSIPIDSIQSHFIPLFSILFCSTLILFHLHSIRFDSSLNSPAFLQVKRFIHLHSHFYLNFICGRAFDRNSIVPSRVFSKSGVRMAGQLTQDKKKTLSSECK